MIARLLSLLLACLAPAAAGAALLELSSDRAADDFTGVAWVLADAPAELSAEQALVSDAFETVDAPTITFSRQTRPAWLRLPLVNASAADAQWMLLTRRATLEVLDIWLERDGALQRVFDYENLEQRISSLRRYVTLAAPIGLDAGERATLLIRFKAPVSGWLPMKIVPVELLPQEILRLLALFIACVVGTAALVTYSLVLFVATRRSLYVLYALATSMLLLETLNLQGITTALITPAAPGLGLSLFSAMPVTAAAALYLAFASRFLEIPPGTRLATITRIGIVASSAAAVLAVVTRLFLPEFAQAAINLAWIIGPSCFVALSIITVASAGIRRLETNLLVVAWTLLALQFVNFLLRGAGVLEPSAFDWYLLGVVCLLEALLVAASIALNVRRLQTEKDALATRHVEALEEMQSRAQLVLAAGHDVRNMIAGARSVAQEMVRSADSDAAEELALRLSRELEGIHRTTDTLISGNRQVGGAAVPVVEAIDVDALFHGLELAVRPLARELGKHIRWRSQCREVAADRSVLQRVLGNLLLNALRHGEGDRIVVVCRQTSTGVHFRVHDQGPGIAPERLRELLSAQQRPTPTSGGAGEGVGLRSCQQLAAESGAVLEARSNPVGGSMFGLLLPAPDLAERETSIVVVGDDAVSRRCRSLLEGIGQPASPKRFVHVFGESVDDVPQGGPGVVLCHDRSPANLHRWSQQAACILCFPPTLSTLFHAAALASRAPTGQARGARQSGDLA